MGAGPVCLGTCFRPETVRLESGSNHSTGPSHSQSSPLSAGNAFTWQLGSPPSLAVARAGLA